MESHPENCPECRQGKHANCPDWSVDLDTDDIVPCPCAQGGHA